MEQIIDVSHQCYPKELLKIKNKPLKLHVIGNEKLLNNKCIAIVGSRNCTAYGFKVAKQFAKELSQNDITIVSGLALGIDSAAHLGALEGIGSTIAVLGHGFKYIFPEENEELYKKILNNNGCIITEYDFDVEPNSKNFPQRNRIVSGISMGVLIVEAKSKSGSTITARLAKEQGKNVFCVPSNLDSIHGLGTNRLIQKGTKLVLGIDDILEEYNIKNALVKDLIIEDKKIEIKEEYLPIYNLISNEPININELCKKSKMNISKVNQILTMLEIEGVIEEKIGKEFIRK
ncbi:MAG: DNA-protecting protein DprA [Clostridiales bacterium]|nr:DNA-protecting protein DprA [Clostridiales bacterium]